MKKWHYLILLAAALLMAPTLPGCCCGAAFEGPVDETPEVDEDEVERMMKESRERGRSGSGQK